MFKFIKNLFKEKEPLCGLLPLSEDKKDLTPDKVLGWSFKKYKTKFVEKTLPLLSWKFQEENNCTFNSGTSGKEPDERIILSVRCATAMGKKLGLIKGNGYADLRVVEMVKHKFGICTEAMMPSERLGLSWDEYSDPKILTPEVMADAAKHKSATFLKVDTVDQLLKFIDEGRTVRIGGLWKTSFNMRGGFSFPFILDYDEGSVVGGHAYLARGYKNSGELIKKRNSYGKLYGADGDFWSKKEDVQRQLDKYGGYVDWDMPVDLAKWLRDFDGKVVKAMDSANVYLIQDGKKKLFPRPGVMYAFGFIDEDILRDETGMLANVPKGDDLKFWEGNEKCIKIIKVIILREPHLKSIFGDDFGEEFKV